MPPANRITDSNFISEKLFMKNGNHFLRRRKTEKKFATKTEKDDTVLDDGKIKGVNLELYCNNLLIVTPTSEESDRCTRL
ncbi:hypothetical protein NPIL_87001 [Nephila pilipes]|uniref:Uncharacterized protein n=1 Tax=Nephila pilipes TaxID=299642 RepID=A0A8X6MZ88_NEPPI|nr:hypothetical protein NPIL_87001 [Nephila pilipes]